MPNNMINVEMILSNTKQNICILNLSVDFPNAHYYHTYYSLLPILHKCISSEFGIFLSNSLYSYFIANHTDYEKICYYHEVFHINNISLHSILAPLPCRQE